MATNLSGLAGNAVCGAGLGYLATAALTSINPVAGLCFGAAFSIVDPIVESTIHHQCAGADFSNIDILNLNPQDIQRIKHEYAKVDCATDIAARALGFFAATLAGVGVVALCGFLLTLEIAATLALIFLVMNFALPILFTVAANCCAGCYPEEDECGQIIAQMQ